jgi:hypothetical protein|tara:strand:- start:142 stop:324 length:183 start_codon:yes stop_codon:yes gene_type:complete
MAKDKPFCRMTVISLSDGERTSYTLATETDWSFFEQHLEIKDISGLKAYYPIGAVWWEIV